MANFQIGDEVKYRKYYDPFTFGFDTGFIRDIKDGYFVITSRKEGQFIESISNRILKEHVISKTH